MLPDEPSYYFKIRDHFTLPHIDFQCLQRRMYCSLLQQVAAKKAQVAADKTFGLKNKNKSKKVQQYVELVKSQVGYINYQIHFKTSMNDANHRLTNLQTKQRKILKRKKMLCSRRRDSRSRRRRKLQNCSPKPSSNKRSRLE